MIGILPTHPASRRRKVVTRELARRAARQRGAVLVEALIVISLLILGFMGVSFFREYYVKTLVASRLARGSILAYSMSGCENNNEPAQWIGRQDLANLTAARADTGSRPASNQNTGASTTASGEAGQVMSKLPGFSGDGKGIMNPIANSDLTGRVRATTSEGGLSQRRTIFDSPVRARSFVSCGDPVRNGDFGDVIGYIGDFF